MRAFARGTSRSPIFSDVSRMSWRPAPESGRPGAESIVHAVAR